MTTVTLVRGIPAARDAVWRAFTDEAEYERWFWPDRLAAVCSLDARPGGRWRVASRATGMVVAGEFVAVEPLVRLSYTWRWAGEDAQTHVTVGFTDTSDGSTTVHLEHDGFASQDEAAMHEQGWRDCLGRLPAAMAEPSPRS